jgi:hypothetical protein
VGLLGLIVGTILISLVVLAESPLMSLKGWKTPMLAIVV